MRTIFEIRHLFSNFELPENAKRNNLDWFNGSNWHTTLFRPWTSENKINYAIRLYGEAGGSIFPTMNGEHRFLGEVKYQFNLESEELSRLASINSIHESQTIYVEVGEILTTL